MFGLISNKQRRSSTVRADAPLQTMPRKDNLVNSLPKLRANPRTSGVVSATSRSSMPVQVTDIQSILKGVPEPQNTLAPTSSALLLEMLQFCKVKVDFSNIQTMNHRSKKADYLTRVFNNVSNIQSFRNLSEELRKEIFKMVKVNLIREIPPIPLTIIYADSKIPINTNDWMHISIIHRILYSFVSNSETSSLKELLTKDFIEDFVGLFESPDPKETLAVENFVVLVFDTVAGYRQMVFQAILKQILKYRDNDKIYPCVAPCLRFMLHFLKSQQLPLKSPFFGLYKSIIFPLISTKMSSEFFLQFNQVAEFFVTQDKSLSTWSLKEMVKYWPMTDSNKECAFINHFGFIVSHIPPDDILECGQMIFKILHKSLFSYNFKVNAAALSLLSNKSFLVVFSPFFSQLVPVIMPGVDRCSQHWNQIVQKSATDAARVIVSANPDISQKFDKAKIEKDEQENREKSKNNWMTVLSAASKNDSTINTEKIEKSFASL